jgi:hypothetical protein
MVTPLVPLASSITQSFVEHSPSTVIALNVSLTVREAPDPEARGRASVVTAPASSPCSVRSCRTPFHPANGDLARPGARAASSERIRRHDGPGPPARPDRQRGRSRRKGAPNLVDVEGDADDTCRRDQDVRRDTRSAARFGGHFARDPQAASPVHALAQPLFTTIARDTAGALQVIAREPRRRLRRFVVKTAAASPGGRRRGAIESVRLDACADTGRPESCGVVMPPEIVPGINVEAVMAVADGFGRVTVDPSDEKASSGSNIVCRTGGTADTSRSR